MRPRRPWDIQRSLTFSLKRLCLVVPRPIAGSIFGVLRDVPSAAMGHSASIGRYLETLVSGCLVWVVN